MESWMVLARAEVPEGDQTLTLVGHPDEGFAIEVDGRELMGTDQHGSEDALADLACDRLARLDDARVLVGGLGMGFTLAAVLRRIGPAGVATVAELVPEVVQWNLDYVGDLAGHPLRDPRVEVCVGDVFDLMDAPPKRWNAILLDVDNGPCAFTRQANGALYTNAGLKRAWSALEPGGILGVWSSEPYPFFTRRLRKHRFDTEVIRVDEPGTNAHGAPPHVLWMARRR